MRILKTEIRICKQCGKEWEWNSHNHYKKQLFCCHQCSMDWRRGKFKQENSPSWRRIKVKCLECGKEVIKPPSAIKRSKHIFCSNDCAKKYFTGHNHPTWAGGKTEATCPVCGTKFNRNSYERKLGLHTFCSEKCFGQSLNTRKEKSCVVCQKSFIVKIGRAETSKYCSAKCYKEDLKIRYKGEGNPMFKGMLKYNCIVCGKEKIVAPGYRKDHKGMFCSKPCKGKWMTENMVGVNHPNWLGGPRQYPVGWNHKYKEVIRTRDERICKVCGIPENGHKHSVHHIDYERENLDVKNLVTVCLSCHLKTNFNRDVWQNYFENRIGV